MDTVVVMPDYFPWHNVYKWLVVTRNVAKMTQ